MKKGINAFIVFVLCTAMLATGFPFNTRVSYAVTESTTSYTEYVQNWNAEAGGDPDGWSKWAEDFTCSEFELYEGMGHTGNRSLRITNDNVKSAYWYQEITGLAVGASYRVEGWIKPKGINSTIGSHGACLNVDMEDANNNVIASVCSQEIYGVKDWIRVSFVFTVVSGTTKISLQAKLWSNFGTAYFDDISMKREYMLNTSAESGSGSPDNYSTWSDGSPAFTWDNTVACDGNMSLKIYQASTVNSCWYQNHTDLAIGNSYTLAGWVKTDTISVGGQGVSLSVNMKDSDGASLQTVLSSQLHGTNDWTYLTCTFTVATGTATVAISGRIYGSLGTAWFDDFSVVPSSSELLTNGSMETGTQNPDNFIAWANPSGQSTFTWDNTAFLSTLNYALGHRSLKITNNNSTVTSCWYQDYLDLTVGKTYKLMGWIKTENAVGTGARFSIDQKDVNNNVIRTDYTASLTGTNDWTYVTQSFTLVSGCVNTNVVAKLYTTSGTAWFDAISVIEVGTAITEPSLTGSWWNNFPRFTWISRDQKAVAYTEPSVLTYAHGMMDEGRAPYFRQVILNQGKPLYSFLQTENIKKMAYLEGEGTSVEIIGAIHDLGGGTYEQDQALDNGPRLYADCWSWDSSGPGMNPNANTVVWMGLASYVNQASWLGSYIRPVDLPAPTYYDGSSALGYFDGDVNPYKAKIYDAMASKDINGGLSIENGGIRIPSENKIGTITVQQWGVDIDNVGYFRLSKDQASSWWNQYNIKAARYFIDNNADGFWVDNYTGWNALHFTPVNFAFGDYSVAGFRDYLKANPIDEVPDPDTFDVRTYLKNQFITWWPAIDPNNLNNSTTIAKWKDPNWLDNNVWKHYLSYKSKTQSDRASEFYTGIKNEAIAAGKDPDQIFIGGNDVTRITFAAVDGNQMDAVNCEYVPADNPVTVSSKDGLPPYGRGGTFYEMASNFAKSRNAGIWLYLDGDDAAYRGKTSLGEVLGFEALAHNCKLNDGYEESKIVTNRIAGTNKSARIINRFIKSIASVFDKREKYAKVGLLYSSSSELWGLAPGGYANNRHVEAFNGWGQALEELNVPYRVITDFKLTLENLAGIQVLIVPYVDCISQSLIDNVLTPFHNNGGTIKITGSTSGNKDLRQNNFENHASALLYDLITSGVAEFEPNQPDIDFYNNHLTTGTSRTNSLNTLNSIINDLYSEGKLEQVLQLTNINDFVNTTANYDSTANRFFADFVNGNIDKSTDTITDEDGGTCVVKLPAGLQGGSYSVKWYDGESEGSYVSPSFTIVDSTKISVSVPSFHVYGTLVISR